MARKKVTLIILLLLIFSDILETFIHFCFKKSALIAGTFSLADFSGTAIFLSRVISSPFLWLGLLTVFSVFVIWSTILSKIDLSVAVPIASFSYILVPLVSIVLLHEKVPFLRWGGIAFILIGVILVSATSTEEK